jgi:hypothetical protein
VTRLPAGCSIPEFFSECLAQPAPDSLDALQKFARNFPNFVGKIRILVDAFSLYSFLTKV